MGQAPETPTRLRARPQPPGAHSRVGCELRDYKTKQRGQVQGDRHKGLWKGSAPCARRCAVSVLTHAQVRMHRRPQAHAHLHGRTHAYHQSSSTGGWSQAAGAQPLPGCRLGLEPVPSLPWALVLSPWTGDTKNTNLRKALPTALSGKCVRCEHPRLSSLYPRGL